MINEHIEVITLKDIYSSIGVILKNSKAHFFMLPNKATVLEKDNQVIRYNVIENEDYQLIEGQF